MMDAPDLPVEPTWYYTALTEAENKCQNCGSYDGITAKLIVPEEAGGKKIPSNCAVLCKTCRFNSERSFKSEMFPTSFFVSQALHSRLDAHCRKHRISLASIVRNLVSHFVLSEYDSFESMWSYQETERDVKLNVQVNSKDYAIFREILAEDRRTVQEAMVALLHDYLENMENVNV